MRIASVFVSILMVLLVCRPLSPAAEQPVQSETRLWVSAARAAIENSDYDSAARFLKEQLKGTNDPDIAYAYLYCLYQKGSYWRLLTLAGTKRFAGAASEIRGQILMGLAYWRRGDLVSALQPWVRVASVNPRNDGVWECIRVAILSAPRRNRSLLIQMLQSALGNSPFGSDFLQGMLYFVRGETEHGEEHFLAARAQIPESVTLALAFRDLYRHTGDVAACRRIDEWLSRVGHKSDGTYKSNRTNESYITSASVQASPQPYRLPWPAGRAIFCASHEGRLETPHSDRGLYALDFLLPQRMPILAARGGVVRAVEDTAESLGNEEFATRIVIAHGDGTFARYYHLRGGTARVRVGQAVRQGDVLAESGRTGQTQAQHLHFEVLREDRWRLTGPKLYWTCRTIPVDFEETVQLKPEEIPDRWLVSNNGALLAPPR